MTFFKVSDIFIFGEKKMFERFTSENNLSDGIISASKKKINSSFDTHWHEFYEIEYIISGSGTYTVDGKEYRIRPGMIFFMTPVNFHSVDAENAEIYNIMFSGSACNERYLSTLLKNSATTAFCADEKEQKFFEAVFSELTEESNRDIFPLLTDCLTAKICKRITQEESKPLTVSQTALLYISDNFRSPVSLKTVAAHIGISPTYLSETFKKQTGTGFKEYVNSLRFEYARKLLLHSDMTVIEVCNESGFEDYANFIRRFKTKFGVSPTQYRKTGRKK